MTKRRMRPDTDDAPDPGARGVGVDVGGMIVDLAGDETGASLLGDRHLEAPLVPGALSALHALNTGIF